MVCRCGGVQFKRLFEVNEPHRDKLPPRWESKSLTRLQRMCFLRCLRPGKITLAVQDFVTEAMGVRFIQPPPFDLAKCYQDSHVGSPLIFVLSTGSDPTKAFYNFASQVRVVGGGACVCWQRVRCCVCMYYFAF